MKNLAHIADKLEDVKNHAPMRERNGDIDFYRDYNSNDFPYARLNRFLESNIGKHWDNVVSDFVHADWVPVQYRRYSKLTKHVEVNTFLEGNKVFFYDDYSHDNPAKCIDDTYGNLFYVDPRNRTLAFKRKVGRKKYQEMRYRENAKTCLILGDYDQLLKLDGIWYHVWADKNDAALKHFAPHARLLYDSETRHAQYNRAPYFEDWYMNYIFNRPKIYKRQLSKKDLALYSLTNDVKPSVVGHCTVCGGDKAHCCGHRNK